MITASIRLDDRADERLEVLHMVWRGEITGVTEGTVDLIHPEESIVDGSELVGHRLVLQFADDESGRTAATPSGIVASVAQDYDLDSGFQILRVSVQPTPAHLETDSHSRVFVDRSAPEIVTAVLEACGLQDGADFTFRLNRSYPPIPVATQLSEPDFGFVRRLCEFWGLLYAFEPRQDGADLVVFADDPRALTDIPGATIPYVRSGYRFGVTRLQRALGTLPTEVVLRNYVHERPEATLQVTRPVPHGTRGRLVESDHNFRSVDGDGAFLARLRVDALTGRRLVYSGEAAATSLRAGQLCTVTGHPVWGDVRLLVVSVETTYDGAPLMRGGDTIAKATQRFTAMPLELDGAPLLYRPPRVTPKPRIHGVLHGVVEESDDRLAREIDSAGRYDVRLLTLGVEGEAGSPGRMLYPRVRMAQPVGGAGSGMHFPLHPGTEVLLSFVDGDPDRPFICGAVPNPRDRSPVAESTRTKNIVQTAAGSRLELDDGPLTAGADGRAVGPAVTGKLHVPYEESRTGSYLRLGRADDREAAESRGAGPVYASDGWFDMTNGGRTSITMGDAAEIHGGTRVVHQYGPFFRVKHGRGLPALAPAGPASEQAGAGGDQAGGQMRMAATVVGDNPGTELTAEYDGTLGQHKVTISKAAQVSTYTAGTTYSFFAGATMQTTVGAYLGEIVGLWYRIRTGAMVNFDIAWQYLNIGGWAAVCNTADSWDTSVAKRLDATTSLTLTMRNAVNTAADVAAAKTATRVAQAGTALNVAAGAGARAAMAIVGGTDLSQDKRVDAVEEIDNWGSVARMSLAGATTLVALTAANYYVRKAKRLVADVAGTGPELKLTPTTARIGVGPTVGAASMTVEGKFEAASAVLSAGPTGGGWVEVTPAAVTIGCGASFIKVEPARITLSAAASGIQIAAGQVMAPASRFVVMGPAALGVAVPPVKL